jgi:hypothetical protein
MDPSTSHDDFPAHLALSSSFMSSKPPMSSRSQRPRCCTGPINHALRCSGLAWVPALACALAAVPSVRTRAAESIGPTVLQPVAEPDPAGEEPAACGDISMSAMAVGNANFRGLLTHDRNWSRYGGVSIPLSCDIGCGDIGEVRAARWSDTQQAYARACISTGTDTASSTSAPLPVGGQCNMSTGQLLDGQGNPTATDHVVRMVRWKPERGFPGREVQAMLSVDVTCWSRVAADIQQRNLTPEHVTEPEGPCLRQSANATFQAIADCNIRFEAAHWPIDTAQLPDHCRQELVGSLSTQRAAGSTTWSTGVAVGTESSVSSSGAVTTPLNFGGDGDAREQSAPLKFDERICITLPSTCAEYALRANRYVMAAASSSGARWVDSSARCTVNDLGVTLLGDCTDCRPATGEGGPPSIDPVGGGRP